MPTIAAENYLKHIEALSTDDPGSTGNRVPMGRLAAALQVAPGTATAMARKLAAAGLIDYEPYAGVLLTQRGRMEARDVLRRHRLVECFLVEVLGLDWSEVHEEAEQLEHAVSERCSTLSDGWRRADRHQAGRRRIFCADSSGCDGV